MDLSECQSPRYNGDNPLDTFSPLHRLTHFTTFYHHNPPTVYEKTTFSPLTLSGRPVFYYIYFPDKKGRFRTRRGETSLRVFHDHSVMVLYPSTREWVCFTTLQRGDISVPHSWWRPIVSDTMDYILLHIILTVGFILYVISYSPLYVS